jgi:hypothetical protein
MLGGKTSAGLSGTCLELLNCGRTLLDVPKLVVTKATNPQIDTITVKPITPKIIKLIPSFLPSALPLLDLAIKTNTPYKKQTKAPPIRTGMRLFNNFKKASIRSDNVELLVRRGAAALTTGNRNRADKVLSPK